MKRLEALNGGPLRYQPPEEPEASAAPVEQHIEPAAIIYRREVTASRPLLPPAPTASTGPLEEAIPGIETVRAPYGTAYTITTELGAFGEHWTPLRRAFPLAFDDEALRRRLLTRCQAEGIAPEEVLFVDLETTGLAHSPLFLIGVMLWDGDDFVIRQYLARHYGEEAAVTALFLDLACDKRLFVSFNGKSFDLPYVRTRAAACGIPCTLGAAHLDLLHECRRAWKGTLPNCKLQTLEQHICGRPPRVGDIPGAEIPDAYHAFVRTGHAGQMAQIVRHNLMDLVTLAELMLKLPAEESRP
jgi:uncharacterized protein YprB with RNaseH-like and TPR domain